MRKAKVIVISISGKGKAIHKCGSVVTEDQFLSGRFQELLVGGYIQLIEDEKKIAIPVIETTPVKKEEVKEVVEPTVVSKSEGIEDTTRKEIMASLNKAGVKYNINDSKDELYKTWQREVKNKV